MGTIDGSVRPAETGDEICDLASARPTDATSRRAVRRSGHIDRSVERCGDNPASVIELMAVRVRFLTMPARAEIRWI